MSLVMPELQTCPFCGEKEPDISTRNGYEEHEGHEVAIRCEYCGAFGPPADTLDGAKELWMRRKV